MEVGKNFSNIISYNENMAKGMADKLFFLNKIKFSKNSSYVFVDFGCADGILIDSLFTILEEKGINAYYIGYDISEKMIELAKSKFNHFTSSVMFTSSWNEVEEKIKLFENSESILILSSVIHEVYSYAENEDDIDLFWHRVLDTGFKYVCIRDMMVSKDINHIPDIDIFDFIHNNIPFASDRSKYFRDFVSHWGLLSENKNLIHYLLKYRWIVNWEREVNENYFPIYVEDLLNSFIEKYNINYLERFRVPFLEKCWKEDFNIEIKDNTHIKVIFEIKRNI